MLEQFDLKIQVFINLLFNSRNIGLDERNLENFNGCLQLLKASVCNGTITGFGCSLHEESLMSLGSAMFFHSMTELS